MTTPMTDRLLTEQELAACYTPEDGYDLTSVCRYQAEITRAACNQEWQEKIWKKKQLYSGAIAVESVKKKPNITVLTCLEKLDNAMDELLGDV
jgi:hypothetical protein